MEANFADIETIPNGVEIPADSDYDDDFVLTDEEIQAFIESSEPPPWAPLYATKRLSDHSRGYEIIDFMETFMTVPTDEMAGLPLVLPEWQKELLISMFEEDTEGYLRFQTFLWGVARKNGKSMILTGIGLYFLAFGGPGQQVIAAAASAKMALIIFDEAKKQVLDSPDLSKIIKPYKNTLVNKINGSTFKTVAADADKAQGLGGSVILCDEIHAWEKITSSQHSKNFWGALSTSRNNRKESIMIGITTAGANEFNTLVGNLYTRGKKVCALEPSYKNRFGFAWWAVPEDANPLDENNWPLSNPNIYFGHINLSMLRGDLEESMSNRNTGYFFRMSLNMWVKVEGESFLSSYDWKRACKSNGTIPLGARVTAGFDGSIGGKTGSADSTVIVVQDYDTGIFKIWQEWKHDGSDGWHVSSEEVEASLANLFANYDVKDIFFDGSGWDVMLNQWRLKWPNQIQRIPQTRQRITPMANNFVRNIVEGDIFHTDEESLNGYISAAIRTEDGGYAKSKAKGERIDGLVASVLANAARNEHKIKELKSANRTQSTFQAWN